MPGEPEVKVVAPNGEVLAVLMGWLTIAVVVPCEVLSDTALVVIVLGVLADVAVAIVVDT